MVECLVIRPCFDEATSYSYSWCEEVVLMLKEKSIIDLAKENAIREKVEEAIKKEDPKLVIHYDHGNEDRWIGNDERPVVDLDNVELLSGREAYCMNCLSAKTLGKMAYEKKAKAYWGYVQTFTFTTDSTEEFKEFVNIGLKFRLEGKSWKECLQMAKDLAKKLAQKLIEAGKYIASVFLQTDADALRCYTEDNPPEPESCLVSRFIAWAFGYKVLNRLRRVRDNFKIKRLLN